MQPIKITPRLLFCLLAVLLFSWSSCRHKEAKALNVSPEIKAKESKPTIALMFFSGVEKSKQSAIAREISSFYKCQTVVLSPVNLPKGAYYSPRNRYRADSLIAFLKRYKPAAYTKIIGFTNKDISVTKGGAADWGVFGLGFRPGPSCVVSSHRLSRNKPSQQVVQERLSKVALHELGHTMGVPHCTSGETRCFMQDARGKLSTVDKTEKYMCAKCRSLARL